MGLNRYLNFFKYCLLAHQQLVVKISKRTKYVMWPFDSIL